MGCARPDDCSLLAHHTPNHIIITAYCTGKIGPGEELKRLLRVAFVRTLMPCIASLSATRGVQKSAALSTPQICLQNFKSEKIMFRAYLKK